MNKEIYKELDRIWHFIFAYSKEVLEEKQFPLDKMGIYDVSTLHIIGKSKQVKVKDVSAELHIAKSTMTSILNRLEKQNLVIRKNSDNDKRSIYLELTDQGMRILQQHEIYENLVYSRILNGLNEEEQTKLIELLKKGCNLEE